MTRWTCLYVAILFAATSSAQSNPPSQSAAPPTAQTNPAPATGAQAATTPSPRDSTGLVIVKLQEAAYPAEAAREKIQGRVMIHLVITETGDVESAEPVSGNPMLAAAAASAMKNWKFKPYFKGGHPVRVSTKLPYDFHLPEPAKDQPGTPAAPPNAPATPAAPPSSTAPAPPGPGGGSTDTSVPHPVLVSQGVSQGLLIHKVPPHYPPLAREAGLQGVVVLRVIIGKEGQIKDLQAVSGHPALIDAALEAVKQWRYQPYYLEGEPVEVQTTINVNFVLSGR